MRSRAQHSPQRAGVALASTGRRQRIQTDGALDFGASQSSHAVASGGPFTAQQIRRRARNQVGVGGKNGGTSYVNTCLLCLLLALVCVYSWTLSGYAGVSWLGAPPNTVASAKTQSTLSADVSLEETLEKHHLERIKALVVDGGDRGDSDGGGGGDDGGARAASVPNNDVKHNQGDESRAKNQEGSQQVAVENLASAIAVENANDAEAQHGAAASGGDGGGDGDDVALDVGNVDKNAEMFQKQTEFAPLDNIQPVEGWRRDSSGPVELIPGTTTFYNVCVTLNIGQYERWKTYLNRGILYFTTDPEMIANPNRCQSCPNPVMTTWGTSMGRDEKHINKTCGQLNQHSMYASSVSDWNACMSQTDVIQRSRAWEQVMQPSHARQVHWVRAPTLSMQWTNENIGHSLFDMFYSLIPTFYRQITQPNEFKLPYTHFISLQDQACLVNSKDWFCTLLRLLGLYDELTLLENPPKDGLVCFEELWMPRIAWNRHFTNKDIVHRDVVSVVRKPMYEHFGLNGEPVKKVEKLLFYAHEPSGRRVWLQMEELLDEARQAYPHLQFDSVKDFSVFNVEEQAKMWNRYDVHIGSHGAQYANSFFTRPGTAFIEVDCAGVTFIGRGDYMEHIQGTFAQLKSCAINDELAQTKRCAQCVSADIDTYDNFTVPLETLTLLLRDIKAIE